MVDLNELNNTGNGKGKKKTLGVPPLTLKFEDDVIEEEDDEEEHDKQEEQEEGVEEIL